MGARLSENHQAERRDPTTAPTLTESEQRSHPKDARRGDQGP